MHTLAVVIRNVFYSELYQNNIFFIFLKLFLISSYYYNFKT